VANLALVWTRSEQGLAEKWRKLKNGKSKEKEMQNIIGNPDVPLPVEGNLNEQNRGVNQNKDFVDAGNSDLPAYSLSNKDSSLNPNKNNTYLDDIKDIGKKREEANKDNIINNIHDIDNINKDENRQALLSEIKEGGGGKNDNVNRSISDIDHINKSDPNRQSLLNEIKGVNSQGTDGSNNQFLNELKEVGDKIKNNNNDNNLNIHDINNINNNDPNRQSLLNEIKGSNFKSTDNETNIDNFNNINNISSGNKSADKKSLLSEIKDVGGNIKNLPTHNNPPPQYDQGNTKNEKFDVDNMTFF